MTRIAVGVPSDWPMEWWCGDILQGLEEAGISFEWRPWEDCIATADVKRALDVIVEVLARTHAPSDTTINIRTGTEDDGTNHELKDLIRSR